MVNCLSKEFAHNECQEYNLGVVEIVKKLYQVHLFIKDGLANVAAEITGVKTS